MEEEIKVKSVSEYLNLAYQTIKNADKDGSSQIFWFRGEGSTKWETPIVPSICRVLASMFKSVKDDLFNSHNLKKVEEVISSDFLRQSLPYIITKGIENTGWNRYFLMQHYKMKTRLLD